MKKIIPLGLFLIVGESLYRQNFYHLNPVVVCLLLAFCFFFWRVILSLFSVMAKAVAFFLIFIFGSK
ncbi:hypothetical protein [Enterococcus gilvus]|uniref:hypothetical protein n=1 Tax=Enterococcus gilvus TaxID=160453 RepID=UPI003EDA1023